MRKLAAAILAVPVIVLLYASLIVRRSVTSRAVLVLAIGAFLTIGVVGVGGPARTNANPPTSPVPVTSAAVRTDLRVGQAPNAPIAIAFSTPMNVASVAASIGIEPATAVDLHWNAERTELTVVPLAAWKPGVFYTITVQPGALADTGRPLSRPTRAAFLVRPPTKARITATESRGGNVAVDSAFLVTFDRPVDPATLADALRVDPMVAGTIEPVGRRAAPTSFVFHPRAALKPATVYRLSLSATVLDVDGAPVAVSKTLSVRTVSPPRVVRFRPRTNTRAVARSSTISVRFTAPMEHRTTKAAFKVTVGSKTVRGTLTFAEGNRVLVFDPSSALPAGKRVTVTVKGTAASVTGLRLAKSVTSSFVTKSAATKRPVSRRTAPIARSGGGSVGGGTWAAVESYYLRLMNCTRTGGWVTSSGSCSSPGGRAVAPLRLDRGISSRVSRPYAKYLATHGACSHFIGGNPGDRLRRAGYTSYIWAENLGCRSGNPYSAVLGSHLFFQSERPYNGGHYVNMMNAKYDRAGIGVWVSSGRVRLVVDFYHPR